MDELSTINDSNPPDKGITNAIEALSLICIQSPDAPTQMNDNFSREAQARFTDSMKVSVISKSKDNEESTSQLEDRAFALNAEKLRDFAARLDGSITSQEAYETDSTISIMGSTINDDLNDDEGVNKMDTLRWKSSIRMHRTNAGGEIIEEDERPDRNTNEIMENVAHNESAQGIDASSEDQIYNAYSEKLTTNRDIEENAQNVSMECHIDTSHLTDESQFMDDTECSKHSNVVLVADFSNISSIGDAVGNQEISDNESVIRKAAQESPIRLSFRNIQRMTSPRLPATNEISRVGNSSALPLPLQLARNCFSFQDTTIDEDSDVLHQTQIGKPDEMSNARGSSKQQFYGLSAVASFPDEESNHLSRAIALTRTSKSYQQQFPPGTKNQHTSPFEVIKRSKTWGDHHVGVDNSNVNNSHFKKNAHLTHHNFEKAMSLLTCMVEKWLNYNTQINSHLNRRCEDCTTKTHNDNFDCEKCSARLTQIAHLIEKESSTHEDTDAFSESQFPPEMRSDGIDALLMAYNFAKEITVPALAAHQWLESHSLVQDTDNVNAEESMHIGSEVKKLRLGEELKIPSMLSNSSDSIDVTLEEDNSLILCPPYPAVKLNESNESSFALFEKRMDADLKVESMKEIIRLKAALEEANRMIAALESSDSLNNQEDPPFPSDIEPIRANDDGGHIFMKIAQDIESCDQVNVKEQPARLKLDDPSLAKELEDYRAAIIDSISSSAKGAESAQVAQDMSNSCDLIQVRMLDSENFLTEWGNVSLPPPPDHELHSPIVNTILSRWTDDEEIQNSLLKWAEKIIGGCDPDEVPPLKIASLDHELKEAFIMHVFPLLLRRKDIHVHLASRATRITSYDIAVSVESAEAVREDAVANDAAKSMQPHLRENKHHLMAFRSTVSGSAKDKDGADKSVMIDQHSDFPEIIRNDSNAGSCYTAITRPISNRTPTKTVEPQAQRNIPSQVPSGNTSFPFEPQLPIMAGVSPCLVDNLSVGSSVDDEDIDNNQELRKSSLMNSIGDAFGLLSRKKLPPSHVAADSQSHSNMYQTPQRLSAKLAPSPEQDHPYHRLVSAPPGKIGLTFVERRGHCMVSNITSASPLLGYVHPSDILIAVNDIPVSGLRTREIVKLLTEKKDQRRDLRMISSHDMNELIRPGTA